MIAARIAANNGGGGESAQAVRLQPLFGSGELEIAADVMIEINLSIIS